jgi:hypothetical protein
VKKRYKFPGEGPFRALLKAMQSKQKKIEKRNGLNDERKKKDNNRN